VAEANVHMAPDMTPAAAPLVRAARLIGGRATLGKLKLGCKRLLAETGELNGMAVAADLVQRLTSVDDEWLSEWFDWLADELGPDPAVVLAQAQAYAQSPSPSTLAALTIAAEPPRQELLRRLNRMPGGTAAILRLRRALLQQLPRKPAWATIEADLLHLLSSWFNPGFLQMRRVDWSSPAELLEKIIQHEAVHTIAGWDDLRRRLQPDRRCFAFFHPQLRDEPLIFVEVALLPEMPTAIGPLVDPSQPPARSERSRVAAFYGISNCEPGLRSVSLGNFLIKNVAVHLQRELPRLKTFCTLSPIPGFARWLQSSPDMGQLPGLRRGQAQELTESHTGLLAATQGDLRSLQTRAGLDALGTTAEAALKRLCTAYLLHLSVTAQGDPVARFHLDNGARVERLNPRANLSTPGLKQSFGMMVNYLYDLDKVEASHTQFRRGDVARSRAVSLPS
jgi:malonyl-CoA decarboxylase